MKFRLIVVFLIIIVFSACGSKKTNTNIGVNENLKNQDAMELVLKMFEECNLKSNYSKTVPMVMDIQIRQNPDLKPFRSVLFRFFYKYMGWDTIKYDIAKVYLQYFTIDEIKQLNDFYTTPVGKKLVSQTPEIMQKGFEIGQVKVKAHLGELKQMIIEEQKRLSSEN